ncbi:xylulokinase [Oceanicola granulosus HTCC2516]|uniref:Xylulokinase n=1 Tax=Oceanicola granulosus (strain ATCC BAA-861 / DSM 15982 / KCTC 12143 / HTCC2516) TaxID=314256 RepID=Q2CBU6_OCEGH|nr:FGGY-family carbohydrate kinase [Oceanicola granulosus]EAR50174.1 xylulokinase [Oceanicola granulosus HTCC2516]
MPPSALFIGLDIGTSSVKAVLGGPGGARLDGYAGRHGTARGAAGAAEQDPDDWMVHVEAALARFAAHPRAGEVAAIGVTSQVNTHVFVGADGAPLAPALTWQDTRAAAEAALLDAALTEEAKVAALGAPIPIDASHALARMAWMAAHRPGIWAATNRVLLPKDHVIARLTGEIAADPIAAVGLVGPDLRYAAPLLDLVPRAASLLPPLADPLDLVGEVRDGPFTGVPVAAGTMDAWAGMFGLGVAEEGQGMYLSGTSDVLGLIAGGGAGAAGIVSFPAWRGIRLHAGPTQSGGGSLAWLAGLLGGEVAELGRRAETVRIGRDAPLFLPHLAGERAPLWDPASRGAFVGLDRATDPAALVASVMEGVAFSARLALEAVERAGGRPAAQVRLGGGGALSDAWCRIRADALGRPLARVAEPEAGAMGALVMAAVASGALADLGAAARALVKTERVFEPDPAAVALAEDRFAAYQELYRAAGHVNARLAGG